MPLVGAPHPRPSPGKDGMAQDPVVKDLESGESII